MQNFYRGGYTSNRKNKKGIILYIISIFMAVLIGLTLAFFANSDFATSLLGMSGRVKITAVGRGDTYQSIEDKDGISNMLIYLQDGYQVLIPGMEIDAQVNVKVHKSTTKPLIRAKFSLELYDNNGVAYNPIADSDNIVGDLEYQLNNCIESLGDWYKHTDNYYYYVGDNEISTPASNTILKEVDATTSDTIVHFINSPIKFPTFVSSNYSTFGVKMIVTFQAIQNYIPDDAGQKIDNTITNSLKIFSSIFDAKYPPTPLTYFDVKVINGKNILSKKEGVTLPETLVLPTEDANGNKITAIDDTFKGDTNIKSLIVPSSYTTISENAFEGSSLTSIDLSNSQIETISKSAFKDCGSLTSVKLPETLKMIDSDAFTNAQITSLILPTSLETLSQNAIYLTKLTSIDIPKNVSSIGNPALNCKSIKMIVVDEDNQYYKDDNKIALLTKDGKKFLYFASGNRKINEYHVPEGVESLENYSFHLCYINQLYLPSSLKTLNKYSFGAMSLFKKIFVDDNNSNFKAVENNTLLISSDGKIAYKYASRNSSTSFVVPDSVEILWGTSFDGLALTNITLGKNVKSDNSSLSFTNSDSLKNIYIDANNTSIKVINDNTLLSKDGKILYRVCRIDDDKYTIPDNVETINAYSFFYIGTKTKSIEFPSSVKKLENVCMSTNYLSYVIFDGTTPPTIGERSFENIDSYKNFKIYVPDSAVNTYKTSGNFVAIADRIYPVSQKS